MNPCLDYGNSLRRMALGLAAGLLVLAAAGCAPEQSFNGQIIDAGAATPVLTGVNWDNSSFELSQLEGSVGIVFFGYSYCPDVCPMTLAKMKQLVTKLDDRSEDVSVVFVSVDPYRDSVDKLANYVPNFDESFYGLRLEQEELDVAQESFGVAVQFGQPKEGPNSETFYYVDHTGSYFLFDRSGKLRLRHPPNATVDQLLPDVETLLAG